MERSLIGRIFYGLFDILFIALAIFSFILPFITMVVCQFMEFIFTVVNITVDITYGIAKEIFAENGES